MGKGEAGIESLVAGQAGASVVEVCSGIVVAGCKAAGWRKMAAGFGVGKRHSVGIVVGKIGVGRPGTLIISGWKLVAGCLSGFKIPAQAPHGWHFQVSKVVSERNTMARNSRWERIWVVTAVVCHLDDCVMTEACCGSAMQNIQCKYHT